MSSLEAQGARTPTVHFVARSHRSRRLRRDCSRHGRDGSRRAQPPGTRELEMTVNSLAYPAHARDNPA
eukprot:4914911-Prymnesium_polylepis.1